VWGKVLIPSVGPLGPGSGETTPAVGPRTVPAFGVRLVTPNGDVKPVKNGLKNKESTPNGDPGRKKPWPPSPFPVRNGLAVVVPGAVFPVAPGTILFAGDRNGVPGVKNGLGKNGLVNGSFGLANPGLVRPGFAVPGFVKPGSTVPGFTPGFWVGVGAGVGAGCV